MLNVITRHNDSVKYEIGPWTSFFVKTDMLVAFHFYGHLIGRFETLTVSDFIKRIRRTYEKSLKRDHLIATLIIANRTETKKPVWAMKQYQKTAP